MKALRDLRAELQCHFAEEEEGACLDEAVSSQPQLSPEMKQIEQEHPRLLAAIDRLIVMAQDGHDRLILETEFDKVCHEMHAHEAAENDILSKAFGEEVDSGGNGVTPMSTNP